MKDWQSNNAFRKNQRATYGVSSALLAYRFDHRHHMILSITIALIIHRGFISDIIRTKCLHYECIFAKFCTKLTTVTMRRLLTVYRSHLLFEE
jgi:hypothetical protein